MQLTAEERSLRARAGAHAVHAKYDSKALSQPARDAFLARFEDQVDPDRVLSVAERRRRADHARKSYMAKLALKSARVRRSRKKKTEAAARTATPRARSDGAELDRGQE